MSKLRDVFCVYEYDMPTSNCRAPIGKDRHEIDIVLDKLRKSVEELEERWVDSRSISHNNSLMANQRRNRSVTSQLESSTKFSKNM